MEVTTDSKARSLRIRKASRSRALDSPVPGEGKVGCLFDEIGNLVEPTERLHMDVQAGLNSHGWRGVARTARLDGEHRSPVSARKEREDKMVLMRACVILWLALVGSLCMYYRALAQEEPSAVSQSPPVLPKVKSFGKGIYYPDQAKRLEAQGRILLGFQINDRGRATRISIESEEANKILSNSAVAILQEFVFERPAAPASAALGSEQYRMSFVFELEPCGGLQHFDVSKDARISVCGSRLRR
jgi:TonB family protein